MKKLFTLLATMIVALTLVAPVYAQTKGEAHEPHAKTGKGELKKKKHHGKHLAKGQQGTNPGEAQGEKKGEDKK